MRCNLLVFCALRLVSGQNSSRVEFMRPWDWFWSTASTSIRIMSQEAQVLPNLGPLKAVVKPRMETEMNSLVVTNVIHSTVKSLPQLLLIKIHSVLFYSFYMGKRFRRFYSETCDPISKTFICTLH